MFSYSSSRNVWNILPISSLFVPLPLYSSISRYITIFPQSSHNNTNNDNELLFYRQLTQSYTRSALNKLFKEKLSSPPTKQELLKFFTSLKWSNNNKNYMSFDNIINYFTNSNERLEKFRLWMNNTKKQKQKHISDVSEGIETIDTDSNSRKQFFRLVWEKLNSPQKFTAIAQVVINRKEKKKKNNDPQSNNTRDNRVNSLNSNKLFGSIQEIVGPTLSSQQIHKLISLTKFITINELKQIINTQNDSYANKYIAFLVVNKVNDLGEKNSEIQKNIASNQNNTHTQIQTAAIDNFQLNESANSFKYLNSIPSAFVDLMDLFHPQRSSNGKYCAFVENLPPLMGPNELIQAFKGCGTIIAAEIYRPKPCTVRLESIENTNSSEWSNVSAHIYFSDLGSLNRCLSPALHLLGLSWDKYCIRISPTTDQTRLEVLNLPTHFSSHIIKQELRNYLIRPHQYSGNTFQLHSNQIITFHDRHFHNRGIISCEFDSFATAKLGFYLLNSASIQFASADRKYSITAAWPNSTINKFKLQQHNTQHNQQYRLSH